MPDGHTEPFGRLFLGPAFELPVVRQVVADVGRNALGVLASHEAIVERGGERGQETGDKNAT